MIGFAEVSACHIWWLSCVRAARKFPNIEAQRLAQQAQAQLVMVQAFYMGRK